MILRDELDTLYRDDHVNFRRSREATYGMTLEAIQTNQDARMPQFRE